MVSDVTGEQPLSVMISAITKVREREREREGGTERKGDREREWGKEQGRDGLTKGRRKGTGVPMCGCFLAG